MSKYKCIRPFSHSGKQFIYGTKINSDEFHHLTYTEQKNFIQVEEESYSSTSHSTSSDDDSSPSFNSSSFDFGSSSDSSSSDSGFSGFDGGSGGGGGADSNW